MSKQETIEKLDILIDFFKQFNEWLDAHEKTMKESI